ncbi:MAG: PSD1 domain-containing protein, partial [Planctomycetaceae bacterium]|nr:PSD1 domain-containing protein [Planctomycetaceae bacterium]
PCSSHWLIVAQIYYYQWMRICSRLTIAGLTLAHVVAICHGADVDFVRDVRPILQQQCYSCHGADKQKSGLRLDVKATAFAGGEAYGASIVAGQPDESPLLQFVADPDADLQMPPEQRLSEAEIATLRAWIEQGANWPDGVDLVQLEDRADHWSLKPVVEPSVPRLPEDGWSHNEIDQFILARLRAEGLRPNPPAERVAWLRRVTLDLTGLPPTPQELADYVADTSPRARHKVVLRLLASPHYGERWAQHWLDVVRYADTHGFEVNTPRPNAWPYRDYVIDALNRDLPYDEFIRDQLVGDQREQQAATGFLVTAAALLPGQIGQDEESKRLARQDELSEVVANVGQTILGLSIGCARCHDHKFDAITSRDYYALQAYFAGLQYGERPLDAGQLRQYARSKERIEGELLALDKQLTSLEPLASLTPLRETSPLSNEEVFEPLKARFVKFTIHDANLHPTLGLIEPCLDEFEIHTTTGTETGAEPQNVALASYGTKVTASGSRESGSHQLAFVNDGQYGNSRSWMSSEAGQGWVLFELPQLEEIDTVVWSRDRNGQFTDRLPIAFTLEAGPALDSLTQLAHVPSRRAAVSATRNVDRFQPVKTQRVRFTIESTNSLEPCLDEFEVFDLQGTNVALASAGATITTSGDAPVSDRHKREHLIDGRYGNDRSWMSDTVGSGWVEITFATPRQIDRIIWGRDRNGKFDDRLPLTYSIAVETSSGEWMQVASSIDRHPFGSKRDASRNSLAGLPVEELAQARELLATRQELQSRLDNLPTPQMVFAGTFTAPEPTHLLLRGDPEQPREQLAPAPLAVLGGDPLDIDSPDIERRQALANWITSPQHPLTARVMVNRIWQWHFGVGLVETANDFGRSGTRPTHPELLDWLASEFVESGWSIKHLHRLIVLSATYGQSSAINPAAQAVDADARLLWRFPSHRLEAEAIRDSMLAVSGRLNLKAGGSGFDLFKSRGGLSGFPPIESFGEEGRRRMIYAHKIRMEREVVFGAFDCPDAGQSAARRRQSTTPIQALNLFNSTFTWEESDAFAKRITNEAGEAASAQVRQAFLVCLGREPTSEELREATALVELHGLPILCRALFNTNEFLFLP